MPALVVVSKPTSAVWPAFNVAPGAAVWALPALAALEVAAAPDVAAAAAVLVAALLAAVDAGADAPADVDAACVPPPLLEEPHAAAPNTSAVAVRAESPTRLPLDRMVTASSPSPRPPAHGSDC